MARDVAEQRARTRTPRANERCTCGRPAVIVFVTDRNGDLPYCGSPNAPTKRRVRVKVD